MGRTYFGSGSAVCTTSSIGLPLARSLSRPVPSDAESKLLLRTGKLENDALGETPGLAAGFDVSAGFGERDVSRFGRETLRVGYAGEAEAVAAGKYAFCSS